MRNCNLAAQYFVAIHMLAIHGFVPTLVGLHHGAVQADPSENTLGARIGQNLRIESNVGGSGGIAPNRSGCYRSICAKLEFVAEEAL